LYWLIAATGDSFRKPFVDLWHKIQGWWPKVLVAIIILVVAWLLSRLGRKLVQKTVERSSTQGHVDILIARGVSALILAAGVVLALWELGISIGAVLAAVGLASLGIGFALQDILSNLFAGVILLIQHPFTMGDQIRVGEQEGVVENVRVRDTQILTYDGERVFIPNRTVFNTPIINFTSTRTLRTDIRIGIKYASQVKEARDIAIKTLAAIPGVLKQPEPVVLVESQEEFVVVVLRFWRDSDRNRGLKLNSDITERVLGKFQAAGIDFLHEVPPGPQAPPCEEEVPLDETQAMDAVPPE